MKPVHKTIYSAGLLLLVLLLAMAASASPAFAKPGNKVTGRFIRVIDPERAWEMKFSAHEAVENKKGKIRPAKGFAMGYRILPDIPGEPLFWVMAVSCTEVFDENYARFAGVIIDHSDPERIGDPIAIEAYDYVQPGNDVDYLRRKPSSDFIPETDCPLHPEECTAFDYAEAFCDGFSNPSAGVNAWYVTEGNIRVHFVD